MGELFQGKLSVGKLFAGQNVHWRQFAMGYIAKTIRQGIILMYRQTYKILLPQRRTVL